VYAIIDDESRFPKATDLTLIENMSKTFTKQSEFQRVKNQTMQFVIHHFAGPVHIHCCNNIHTHTNNHFTALLDFVWDYLGEQAPER